VAELPSGTVTFLFTDLEGSTRLWEDHPEAMKPALARHDEVLREAIEGHAGSVVKTTGDGVHAAFATADDALTAALEAQRALVSESWPVVGGLRVRMGVHTGAAELRDGDYFGAAVNRAARLMAAAHGGQVVVSLATEELVRDVLPYDASLVDLGEHRLRDLSRPERLFQLVHPDLSREFAPLQSLDAFPGNLPVQLNSFVGRERELVAIAGALGESRLVTLTGVGGVGKTRLAVQVAADVLPSFPDGAWLCELAVASDPDAMVQVIAAVLAVQTRPGVSIEDSIREFLRAKRLLLVLDNCEHLLDAAAHFTDLVLHDAPQVRILATSREGLAVDGEHIWALRSLPLPEPSADTDAVRQSDAGRLFVDRARAVHSAFALDPATSAAVIEVCRRLDGVPLAIELAAARVMAMSPAEIAARLDERFRLLTGGRRTAVERHHTLRGTVDWSYSLLSPNEQLVFARLGVFAGTFDAAAAEEVAGGEGISRWDVIDALASLVAKSMVVADAAPDATTRYSMLETLRAYARERLDETGDPDGWRRRHAAHYAGFAERAGPGLEGPDELVWRDRVRAELDNLRAAVAWALDSSTPADAQPALRIVAALAYEAVMDMTSGVSIWAERAVPRADETTPGRRTAILGAAAIQATYVGDLEAAQTLAHDALRDGLPPNCPCPGPAYTALAITELVNDRPDEALRVVRLGLHDLETVVGDDTFKISEFHSTVSMFSTFCGDLATARAEADEGLRLARLVGSPSAAAMALAAAGTARVRVDPLGALAALEAYIALARGGAQRSTFGPALADVGWLKARTGDSAGALSAIRDGVAYCHHIGDRRTLVGVLSRASLALIELGYPEPAAVLTGVVTDGPLAVWDALAGVEADQQDREQALDAMLAALGLDRYQHAAARGAAMSYDEVVDYAGGELERLLVDAHDD
jgi:predicted ATPase/class 3 adenylate cyclase